MIGVLQYSTIHNAASKGDLALIKDLNEKKLLDLDLKSAYGFTPLHFAATNGKIGVVRYLIKNGADVNSKSDSKSTPFHLAARYGHINVLQYLIEHNADIDTRKIQIQSPDFLSKKYKNAKVNEYLKAIK